MMVPVPKEYDGLLKVVYGDYMRPVKGTQSHGHVVLDFDRSYKEVMAELRKQK